MLSSFYQHPAGHGFAYRDRIEQRFQSCVSISSPIETEYEFVEAGLQLLCPQTMIDADLPRFEVGENAVNPGKHVMGQLVSNDLFAVICSGWIVVRRKPIGFDNNLGPDKAARGLGGVI